MTAKAAAGIGFGVFVFASLIWLMFDMLIWMTAHLQILWSP